MATSPSSHHVHIISDVKSARPISAEMIQQIRRSQAPSMSPTVCCCLPIKMATIAVGIIEFVSVLSLLIVLVLFCRQGGFATVSVTNAYEKPVVSFLPKLGNWSMIDEAWTTITTGTNPESLTATFIGLVIASISIILLVVGVAKERPKLILTHFVVQCLSVIALSMAALIYGLWANGIIGVEHDSVATDDVIRVFQDGDLKENGTPNQATLDNLETLVIDTFQRMANVACAILAIGASVEMWFAAIVFKCFRYAANKRLQ